MATYKLKPATIEAVLFTGREDPLPAGVVGFEPFGAPSPVFQRFEYMGEAIRPGDYIGVADDEGMVWSESQLVDQYDLVEDE